MRFKRRLPMLSLPCLILCGAIALPAAAQTPAKERKIAQKTFEGMPVIISQIKNLHDGDDWLRDLEIEVKNVSRKPIYFISLMMEFPDIAAPPAEPRADGLTPARSIVGFTLDYGDDNLMHVARVATPADKALRPGESYVFRVPREHVSGLENMKRRLNFSTEATRNILLYFDTVSFGDSSGFIAGRKVSYMKTARKISRNSGQ
ncbi:MAG TPA: hypothetical protein VEY11_06100 [Pyrinomonadaceae bacterium]|nr:hypothetical protein [Pyrinomonadaceae bacterium]